MENLKRLINTIGSSRKTKEVLWKICDAVAVASEPAAESVSVEAGDDGLAAGSAQDALQALATRVQALEDA